MNPADVFAEVLVRECRTSALYRIPAAHPSMGKDRAWPIVLKKSLSNVGRHRIIDPVKKRGRRLTVPGWFGSTLKPLVGLS